MNDNFTETTDSSWGSRIGDSIKGIVVGFLMFIISFILLYWNEGRVDISKKAGESIEIKSEQTIEQELDKKFISFTGVLKSNDKIGDNFLKSDGYFSLTRNIETFAWVEKVNSQSETNVGGSETTKDTYSYKKEWTSIVSDYTQFKNPEGHENIWSSLETNYLKPRDIQIGIYSLDSEAVGLPAEKPVTITTENAILVENYKIGSQNKYIYTNPRSDNLPQIGDVRISYDALKSPIDEATVFGKLNLKNKSISEYNTEDYLLYRVLRGDRESSISTLAKEHSTLTWILRGSGFALMWVGLMLMFAPISIFLDVLPIFGSISRSLFAVVALLISLVLSIITILISIVFHNIILLIIFVSITIFSVYWYTKKNKKNK